jgi:sugar lactone lactonase YvrE
MRAATTAHRATKTNTLARGAERSRAAAATRVLWLATALVLAAMCAVAAVASAQPAHPNYVLSGIFGQEGFESDQLEHPGHIAVDQATGNVLVTDTGGHNRVAVFKPEGGSASYLTEFGHGELSTPFGIAIDQSTRAVYVSDIGNNRIARYLPSAANPPVYTLDTSYVSPALGSGPGELGGFRVALAVDPTTGDLLVADPINNRVDRYGPSGSFLGSFDGSATSAGALVDPADIAVGPNGDIYVTDIGRPFIDNGGESRLVVFSASGASLGQLGSLTFPAVVTANEGSGMVLVGAKARPGEVSSIYGFIGGSLANQVEVQSPSEEGGAYALAVNSDPGGPLFAMATGYYNGSGSEIQEFRAVLAPGVSEDQPTAVTKTSLVASGKVESGGVETTPHFEYSIDGHSWVEGPGLPAVSAKAELPVEEKITGLAPNTTYLVRLAAVNSETRSVSPSISVTTEASAPDVVLGPVSERTETSVNLQGAINPFGLQTTYRFEYGLTTSYGQRIPVVSDDVVGNGHQPIEVGALLTGLRAGTTYHYRLLATNRAGVSTGADANFTTAGSPPFPTRGYEQVTPVDHEGGALNTVVEMQASPDGEAVVFQAASAFDAHAVSSPLIGRYLSGRSAAGWDLRALDPPQLETDTHGPGTETLAVGTIAVSEDLSHSIAVSEEVLAPGAVRGNENFYRRDTSSGAYELIGTGPAPSALTDFGNVRFFYGGSTDFSTVVIWSPVALLAGAPQPALYRWHGGQLELESVLPGGAAVTELPQEGNQSSLPARFVSENGELTVFGVLGAAEGGVYEREGDGSTTAISVSRVTGASTSPQPGRVVSISADGRYVLFTTIGAAEPLTASSPGGETNYLLDRQANSLEWIGSGPAAMSADGRTILFGSPAMVWHEQTVTQVGDPSRPVFSWLGAGTAVSPDGRFVAFSSPESLTSYPSAGVPEIYLVDAVSGQISCASCASNAAAPAGSANVGVSGELFLGGYEPRFLTDDGGVFFDTPQALVPRDTNGVRDVYEYKDGEVALISDGRGPSGSQFSDASATGGDVFFTTSDRLVKQDANTEPDLYDARVGGGIAAQNQVEEAPCSGLECSAGSGGSPPGTLTPGSASFSGPGNLAPALGPVSKPKQRVVKCAKGKKLSHGKCVKAKAKKKSKAKKKTTAKKTKAKAKRSSKNRKASR